MHGPPQPPLYGLPGHDAVREGALEQPAVRHEDTDIGIYALKGKIRLFHIPEQLEHAGQQRGVVLGNHLRFLDFHAVLDFLRNPGLQLGIFLLKHPMGPGADLVMPDIRVQQ